LYRRNWIVLCLNKSLINQRPSTDMRREMSESTISSPVLVDSEGKYEKYDDFCISDRGIHFCL
jgi:hypothetical protein